MIGYFNTYLTQLKILKPENPENASAGLIYETTSQIKKPRNTITNAITINLNHCGSSVNDNLPASKFISVLRFIGQSKRNIEPMLTEKWKNSALDVFRLEKFMKRLNSQ